MGRPRKIIAKKDFEGLVLAGNGSLQCARALMVSDETLQSWIAQTYGQCPDTGRPHTYTTIAPTIRRNFGKDLLLDARLLSMKSPDLLWKLLKNFSGLSDNPTPEQSEAKPSAFVESLDRLSGYGGEDLDGVDVPGVGKEADSGDE